MNIRDSVRSYFQPRHTDYYRYCQSRQWDIEPGLRLGSRLGLRLGSTLGSRVGLAGIFHESFLIIFYIRQTSLVYIEILYTTYSFSEPKVKLPKNWHAMAPYMYAQSIRAGNCSFLATLCGSVEDFMVSMGP